MKFRTSVDIDPFPNRVSYSQNLLSTGSCFAENIGGKLRDLGFKIISNPAGVLYNPASVNGNLLRILENQKVYEKELFYENSVWQHYDFHGSFSHPDKQECLELINRNIEAAYQHIEQLDWLIITWGTAWIYELRESRSTVANCHKMPAQLFERRILSVDEVTEQTVGVLERLFSLRPELQVLLTVSPVRHLKDGGQANLLSKSKLICAAHELVGSYKNVSWFPAYEIVIDELRDYRFFKEDMAHPSDQAVNYVWECFSEACIDPSAKPAMAAMAKLKNALQHRPIHFGSKEHKRFLQKQLDIIAGMERNYPLLDLENSKQFLNDQLEGII